MFVRSIVLWLAAPCFALDFEREVFPIFERNCFGCHGPKAQMGRLRLDARRVALAGGQSGVAIQPGNSARSPLVARISAAPGVSKMPPAGPGLSASDIALIRKWIDEGATWPAGVGSDAAPPTAHWSYVPPKRSAVPEGVNAIDHFIRARLSREGLAPSAPAARETLLRRASLDLTGLPPTLAEIDVFLGDSSPRAFERQVDRLLASPRFGERWALWWLDLARYADTNGYESDEPRTMWLWRDWVINAFNRNLPFDQFTIEQIAGDLLPNPTEEQLIATGFHRNTLVNSEAGAKDDEFRDAAVKDRLETTSTVWLGSTMGCSQCHNHKYDPFTQRDYYRLYAFFNSTAESAIQLDEELKVFRGDREELARRRAALAPFAKILDTPTPELDRAQSAWEKELLARLPAVQSAFQSLGTVSEQLAELKTQAPIAALRLSRPADAEVEAWTGRDLALMKDYMDAQPDWGDWFMSPLFEAATQQEAHDTAWPPEREVKLDAAWKKRADLPDGAFYQLDGYNCSLYLYRTITARQNQRIKVALGSAQGVKLFLNGKQVFANGAFDELKPDDGLLELDLHSGVNQLLLKYTNGPGYYRYYFKRFLGLDRKQKPSFISEDRRLLGFDPPLTGELLRIRFRQKPRDPVTVEAAPALPGLADYLRMPPAVLAILQASQRTADDNARLAAYYRWNSPLLADTRREYDRLKKEADTYYDQNAVPTLVMRELAQPRESFMQNRGNFLAKGDPVTPGTPAALPPMPADQPANRLGLARWLVSGSNPLTGRVIVNHVWRAVFGTGIVKTGEDFGQQGERPTHPELLDWLAVDFADSKWNFKALVKQMVMSETYQQTSRVDPARLARDPDNRLLSRGPRFRLTAEAVRDSTLSAAGLLSSKIGGPSVFPPLPQSVFENLFIEGGIQSWVVSKGEDRYRRGLYTFYKRTAVYPTFMTFDAPERNVCTVERPRSDTPLQALTTLNDEAFVEASRALAARLQGATPREKLAHGFRLVTSRRPSEREIDSLAALLERAAAKYTADPASARKLTASADPSLAPWIVVSNILLNLDEAMTKE